MQVLNRLISLLFFLLIGYSAFSQIIDPFTVRHQVNQKGGIVMLANISVSCNGCAAVNEMPPGGFGDNNSYSMTFVDIDSDPTTYSSTRDKLDLAACSEITWAGLYWTGNLENTPASTPNYINRDKIKLKVDNGAYLSLVADDITNNITGKRSYHCFKDITAIAQANTITSEYTVANLVSKTGFNTFGGWSIVIVYKNVYQSMRNLTVFDGLANVTGGSGNVDIPISGFLTPLTGPVNFELGVVAHDGDRGQTGDQLQFNGNGAFISISDNLHNFNDVFNSTISRNGVLTPFRNPSLNNNLGHDANIFSPNNSTLNYIGNNSSSATIRITTSSETILTSVVTSAIDIYEPDLRASVSYVDLNGGTVEPGDMLEYSIVSKNIGSDISLETVLTDTLDQRLIYVPGSMNITFGPNAGGKTDPIDTDQAEFIPADNVIVARIGTGANGTTGGQVVNSATGADSTVLKFRVTLIDECLIWQCGNVLENKAFLTGKGQISGITNSNGGTSDNLDINGCPSAESGIVTVDISNCPDTAIVYTDSLCVGETLNLSFPPSALATYYWTGPNGFVSNIYNPSIPNVDLTHAGDYILHFELNGTNCIDDTIAPVFVSENPTIVLNTIHDDTCFNIGDGYIDISGVGNGPYTYTWSNNDTDSVANNLLAGTYSVTVEDVYGCTVDSAFTVTEPPLLTMAASITSNYNGQHISCFNAADGTADVTANGGVQPYSYLWSPSNANTSNAINLDAGYNTVTVTDDNGCIVLDSLLFIEPDSLILSATQINVLCFGYNTGAIDVTVTGGTTPYDYNWTNGGTTQDINNLVAGTYSDTVTDINGCQNVIEVIIDEPIDSMTITFTKTDVLCFGNATGAIDLTVVGGNPPYSFVWSSGPTTEDLTNIPSGTYTVNVTDDNGCVQTMSIVITEPIAGLSTSETHLDIQCFGGQDGSIDLSVAGGTPGYSYLWSNSSTTEDISNLTIGTYTCTITDTSGCTIQQSVTLTEPDVIQLSSVETNILCYSAATGAIDLSVIGGTAPYSFQWSNTAMTEDITNLLPGTYQVFVTDDHGCIDSLSATITQPLDSMTISSTQTDILCFGDSTGMIDVSVLNGLAPYTYLWNTGVTTQDLTNIPSGIHTITVTDANNCAQSSSIELLQPTAPLLVSETHTDALCAAGVQGTIDLTATGGTPGYTYLWNNNQTVPDISNLNAGTYTCVVTDTNGCYDSVSVVITDPDAVVLSEVHTDVSCFAGADGTIDLTISGGTPGYTFDWSTTETTEDIVGLAAGNYFVNAYDVNSCGAFISVVITEPAQPLATTDSITDILCFSYSTGAIDVEVTGGTQPYSYLWSNGVTTQDIQNVIAGTYSLTITDTNGCTLIYTNSVLQPTELIMTETHVDILCNSDATGSIDITTSGGTPGYTYSWDNTSTTEDLTGISAGTYTVIATDSNSCYDTLAITLIEPLAPISLSDTLTHVLCFGGNNGNFDLEVAGGSPGYTYAWSNNETTQDISSLIAGSYQVIVTDSHGCIDSLTSIITEPVAPIALVASMTPVICFGDSTGSVSVVASGGTAPYSYLWDTGDITATATGLSIGTYQVVVTDTNGCIDSVSITVTEPTELLGQISHTDVLCFGASTGSVTTTITGGILNYSYAWNNMATSANLVNVPAGPYEVLVTDLNGCSITLYDTVLEPAAPLNISFSTIDNLCFGDSLGEIDATITGGTAPYQYSWDNGALTQDIVNLTVGTYVLSITDTNNCTLSASVAITEPDLIVSLNPIITNVSCFGGNDGSIDFTPSGGVAPYTFQWDDPTLAQSEDLLNLPIGTYTVIVKDSNNCTQSFSYTIAEPTILTATYTFVEPLCYGYSDGSLTAIPTGGTAPYSYNWSNGATQDVNGMIPAGNYSVTVTDANNCTFVLDCVLGEPDQFNVSFTADTTAGCDPHQITFTNTSDENFICTWDFGDGETGTGTTVSHMYYDTGCHDVTLTVETNLGCTNSVSYSDFICIYPTPDADLDADPKELLVSMGETNISNYSTGATSYIWDLGDGSGQFNYYEPGFYTYPDYFLDEYIVTLIAISDMGCADTAQIIIQMDNELIMYIPNSFTPDGDEFNNVFLPKFAAPVSEYTLTIYNRWGEDVFITNDTEIGWDGTFNGKMVQDGTYVWTVKVLTKGNAKPVVKRGTVTLLR